MGETQAKECTPFHNHESTPRVLWRHVTEELTVKFVDCLLSQKCRSVINIQLLLSLCRLRSQSKYFWCSPVNTVLILLGTLLKKKINDAVQITRGTEHNSKFNHQICVYFQLTHDSSGQTVFWWTQTIAGCFIICWPGFLSQPLSLENIFKSIKVLSKDLTKA